MTTSATANTDGTAVTLLSALAHDVEFVAIGLTQGSSSGANHGFLMDLLIDPAGGTSWSALINDLMVGYVQSTGGGAAAPSRWYYFPLWIPAGASIGARAKSGVTGAQTVKAILTVAGGPSDPTAWWCGQQVTEIGINAATGDGAIITPGNSGTFSAWTNFGSTLPAACGAVQFAHQGGAINAMNALSYHLEFGVNSTRIGPPLWTTGNANEAMVDSPLGPIFCSLAAGSQLQARGTCSGTGQNIDVAAYVVH